MAATVLLGDFNTHNRAWLPGTCIDNDAFTACYGLATSHGLEQMVKEPTRHYTYEGEIKSSCVDLFMTDESNPFEFVECASCIGTADHSVVVTRYLGEELHSESRDTREVLVYSNADWDVMNEFLASTTWSRSTDVNDLWREIRERIEAAVEMFVPRKIVKGDRNKRWFNASTYQSLHAKVDAYNKAKKSGAVTDWNE